jgi:hypothetical protein
VRIVWHSLFPIQFNVLLYSVFHAFISFFFSILLFHFDFQHLLLFFEFISRAGRLAVAAMSRLASSTPTPPTSATARA